MAENYLPIVKDARAAIEELESRGMTCFDCEIYADEKEFPETSLCRMHQITRAFIIKYPKVQ